MWFELELLVGNSKIYIEEVCNSGGGEKNFIDYLRKGCELEKNLVEKKREESEEDVVKIMVIWRERG